MVNLFARFLLFAQVFGPLLSSFARLVSVIYFSEFQFICSRLGAGRLFLTRILTHVVVKLLDCHHVFHWWDTLGSRP